MFLYGLVAFAAALSNPAGRISSLQTGFCFFVGAVGLWRKQPWAISYGKGIAIPFLLFDAVTIASVIVSSRPPQAPILGIASALLLVLLQSKHLRPDTPPLVRAEHWPVIFASVTLMSFIVSLTNPVAAQAGDVMYLIENWRGWWSPAPVALAVWSYVKGAKVAAGILLIGTGAGLLYVAPFAQPNAIANYRTFFQPLGMGASLVAVVISFWTRGRRAIR